MKKKKNGKEKTTREFEFRSGRFFFVVVVVVVVVGFFFSLQSITDNKVAYDCYITVTQGV